MRLIGVIPAVALVLGAASALQFHIGISFALPALLVAAVAAWTAWCCGRDRSAITAMAAAFFCAAAALTADAESRALHPSFSPQPAPVGVRLRLLEDASPQDGFTTLHATVIAVRAGRGWRPAGAGAAITVGGSVAADRAGEWRAGRIIETFATFRRPARYLDQGVPDFERDLALAGTAFFGSIKSAWLVDVRERRERRPGGRGSHPRSRSPQRAPMGGATRPGLGRDRHRGPDRRSHRVCRTRSRLRLQAAGTYHVIAISGGNIAILAGIVYGLLLFGGD